MPTFEKAGEWTVIAICFVAIIAMMYATWRESRRTREEVEEHRLMVRRNEEA